MTIKIPSNDDDRILRRVELDGYTLTTWATGRTDHRGGTTIGYAFHKVGENDPIFLGEDFGSSPMDATDSDASLRSLLGFLTLRPGGTDAEYFENYTERQLAFAATDAEGLSFYAMEERDDPPAFVNLDGWGSE